MDDYVTNEALEFLINAPPILITQDINGDEVIDLKDVITGLQLLSGREAKTLSHYRVDINDDGKIGFEEALRAGRKDD